MQRSPTFDIGLSSKIFVGLAGIQVLAALENALRPGPAIGLIDGALLEALAVSGPLLVALLLDAQVRNIACCVLVLAGLAALQRRVRQGRADAKSIALGLLRFVALALLMLWAIVTVAITMFLGCCYTGRGALVGLALLAAFALLRRRSAFVARNMLYCCSTLGALAFFALNLGQHFSAQSVLQEQIYDQAAYDAEQIDAVYVASETLRQVVVITAGQSTPIEQTWLTQRLCADPQRGLVYAVNYCKRPSMALSALSDGRARAIPLSGCDMPVQAQYDRATGSLLVVCEHSCSVHQLDPAGGARLHDWTVPCLPDALTLDSVRRRIYVSAEIFTTKLTALRLGDDGDQEYRYAGLVNWYVAVDEATGNVFVARGLQGEIAVFSPNLELMKLIRVGNGPRDLAIDRERRLLLTADYFSGTLSLIDLERLELVRQVAVGDDGLVPGRIELRIDLNKFLCRRLRGVSVTPDGQWLAADATGVWRIDPEQALAH